MKPMPTNLLPVRSPRPKSARAADEELARLAKALAHPARVAIEPHEGSRVVAVLKSGARIVASRPGTARLKAALSLSSLAGRRSG